MRIRPAGDAAVLVETDAPHRLAAAVRAAAARSAKTTIDGVFAEVVDVVPGERSVLITTAGDPGRLADRLAELPSEPAPDTDPGTVEVPVVYDGADLAEVADLAGLTVDEVVHRHCAVEYTVAYLGFSPGFGYLTGLLEELRVPRRATPRTSVPAGSVAVAGPYTAVYPSPSPGGWRLLGRTELRMWDVDRDPPCPLAPGARVRFVPVSR